MVCCATIQFVASGLVFREFWNSGRKFGGKEYKLGISLVLEVGYSVDDIVSSTGSQASCGIGRRRRETGIVK